jgi:hypothetical protein
LDQREEKLNTAVQDLNQRHKAMPISKRMKDVQEMNNLQVELKTIQEERHTRQTQLEILQEQAEKMIIELETKKGKLEKVHSESIEVLKEHVTMQVVETLTEKSV